MPSPDLLRSWERTESYLREARASLSDRMNGDAGAASVEFDDYIEHNELGLAFDVLRSVAAEFAVDDVQILASLALAAASMGREDARRQLDSKISDLRGTPHITVLPD